MFGKILLFIWLAFQNENEWIFIFTRLKRFVLMVSINRKSLLIRQTDESQNVCYKETKHAKNKHLLPPDTHTHVCEARGKNCPLFGKFGVLSFLVTPVLRFAFLPYYRQLMLTLKYCFCQWFNSIYKISQSLLWKIRPCVRYTEKRAKNPSKRA